METITISVEMSKGPYTGKLARNLKGYVAKIVGTDKEYGYQRVFLRGKPDSDEPFRKAKCTWRDLYAVAEGLYEISEGGERSLLMVWSKDGKLARSTVPADRARKMAELMTSGAEFDAARLATRAQTA